MKSAFNLKRGLWEIEWPGIVSKHDLVYLSPPDDPMSGIPLGNGETGVLCWVEESRIILAINKSDLWDDAEFGRFVNWNSQQEEKSTTLRHGGRIIVDFKFPIFNIIYLSEFECRLSLADAAMHMHLSGPFGKISFKAFVNNDDGTLCCEIDSGLIEESEIEIKIERYGSRMFHHWYSLVNPDASLGLSGTQAFPDGKAAYIMHKLTSGIFAIGCRILNSSKNAAIFMKGNSHSCTYTLEGDDNKKLVLLAGITSPVDDDPVKILKEQLIQIEKNGIDNVFKLHQQAWRDFWEKSFIDSGNDYMDNVWYLTLYYANSSQKGHYPGRFIGGLWNWNHDFQAWGFYFHWNQQQLYWPLNTAGHHELIQSYLKMRFNGLKHAKEDAKELFGVDGAVVSDVSERRGFNSQLERENHTPGVQIAMDFWRQYQYTQDIEYLRNYALPYMLEIARFFETRFTREKDGLFHAYEGTGYEGGVLMNDVTSEIASAKALFAAVLEAMEITGITDPRSEQWQEIRDNLPSFMILEQDAPVINQQNGKYILGKGIFKGNECWSNKTLAAGFGVKEGRLLTSLVPNDVFNTNADQNINIRYNYCIHMFLRKLVTKEKEHTTVFSPGNLDAYKYDEPDMKGNPSIFPYVEFAAAYPSGIIGISQKDTEVYDALANTARIYADLAIGWNPLPIVLARLGLAKELSVILDSWPDFIPMYANGTVADVIDECLPGPAAPMELRTQRVFSISDKSSSDGKNIRHPFLMAPFRHIGFEAQSIITCALNEMLLQSHGGIIRVAPAAADTQTAKFMLHAENGFIVSSEIKAGKPLWISIRSRFGKPCTIANPWLAACLYRNDKYEYSTDEKSVQFATQKDDLITLVPEQDVIDGWETIPIKYEDNTREKRSKSGMGLLGLPKMYV